MRGTGSELKRRNVTPEQCKATGDIAQRAFMVGHRVRTTCLGGGFRVSGLGLRPATSAAAKGRRRHSGPAKAGSSL